jgi:hypothetical protein
MNASAVVDVLHPAARTDARDEPGELDIQEKDDAWT